MNEHRDNMEQMENGEDRSGKLITISLAIAGPVIILIGYLIGTGVGEAKDFKEVTAVVTSTSVRRSGSNSVSFGSGGAKRAKTRYSIYADIEYDFAGKKRTSEYRSSASFSSSLAANAYADQAFAKGSQMTVYVHPNDPGTVHSTNYMWVEPLSMALQFIGLAMFCGAIFKLAS